MYSYAYDAYKRLTTVTQPGTPGTTIQYHYNLRDNVLLGKSLNGARYSTFAYDHQGRAILSEHAGGVDRNTFAYTDNADGTMTALHTNPLGKQTTSIYRDGKLQSSTGHASPSCGASYSKIVYDDSTGYEDVVTDFAGNSTDYDYSPGGLLMRRVDAANTSAARETMYEYDTNGRVTKQTLVGQVEVNFTYRADGLLS